LWSPDSSRKQVPPTRSRMVKPTAQSQCNTYASRDFIQFQRRSLIHSLFTSTSLTKLHGIPSTPPLPRHPCLRPLRPPPPPIIRILRRVSRFRPRTRHRTRRRRNRRRRVGKRNLCRPRQRRRRISRRRSLLLCGFHLLHSPIPPVRAEHLTVAGGAEGRVAAAAAGWAGEPCGTNSTGTSAGLLSRCLGGRFFLCQATERHVATVVVGFDVQANRW
jgi:hypothetical protein